ncbi:MAG TPA: hypothetical protein VMC09_06500 [Anaerolineales bacterium]|nr:hypothetical protein [Anaerolineales bacterium]
MLIVIRYIIALLLTVAIEGAVAWAFAFRTVRAQLAVAMVNCLTNPALNLLLLILAWLGVKVGLPPVTALEVGVIFVEWGLYIYAFGGPKRRLFVLSLAANAASFLAGLLLFWR